MGKGYVGVRGTAGVGGSNWLLLLLGVLLIMTLGSVPPGAAGVAPAMPEAMNVPADGIQAGSKRAAGELPGRWAVTPTGGFTYTLPPDGRSLTVITTVAIAAPQGPVPSGSSVVKVSVTMPLVILGV